MMSEKSDPGVPQATQEPSPTLSPQIAEAQSIDAEEAIKVAVGLQQANQVDEAEAIYRWLLQAIPEMPEALHFLGLIEHQKGNRERAIELIERAISAAPDYIDALSNLGNIHFLAREYEEAVQRFRAALNIDFDYHPARNNLGLALKELGRFDEAIAEFLLSIEHMPRNAVLYHNLGNVYMRRCRFGDAAQSFRKCIALRPYDARDYENLCRTLYLHGEVEEALPTIHEWLKHDPKNPLALHRLAAYSGTALPERAADEYIRQTFDGFAETFDDVLKGLQYKAPELVGTALSKLLAEAAGQHALLDAGCGTGLCAQFLKPYAAYLEGVDLSPKMIEKAKASRLYDRLVEAELTEHIDGYEAAFDGIVSADTLVYFGELRPVFQAACKALRKGGYLVFTVERLEEGLERGFKIDVHGRFGHAESYVARMLCETGFQPLALEQTVLRYEKGQPVDGLLVTAQAC